LEACETNEGKRQKDTRNNVQSTPVWCLLSVSDSPFDAVNSGAGVCCEAVVRQGLAANKAATGAPGTYYVLGRGRRVGRAGRAAARGQLNG